MRKCFLLIFTLFLFNNSIFAQDLIGVILSSQNDPIPGAVISIEDKNGKFLQGTTSDEDGKFIIPNIHKDGKKILINSLTYEGKSFAIQDPKKNIDLGKVKMDLNKTHALKQVNITGMYEAVRQKDDTLEYNSAAYKTNPDAKAEDLLKKLPGIDYSTGQPKAQGEDVKKVLVDGKPFFGDDPNMALKNLPASMIGAIQVYDEKSEQTQFTGFDDGETSKTINIITKPEARGAWFGRFSAAGGYKDKYAVGGNANYFKGARRLSIIGQSNNINQQNFSSEDLVGISGGRRGGGGFRRRSPSDNFRSGTMGGITNTHALGVNFSDEWWDKMEVNLSYFFNYRENHRDQSLYREYIQSRQLGQEYKETNKSDSYNRSHNFNGRFEYKVDSMTSFVLTPSVSFQGMHSSSFMEGSTTLLNEFLNSTLNNADNKYESWNARSMFLFRHRLAKPGRTISLWANGAYNNRDGKGALIADNQYEDELLNEELDQEYQDYNKGWNLNSNLTYTEPLGEKFGLQAQYGFRYEKGDADKKTYNFNNLTNTYTDLDAALSNEFTTEYRTHRGGLTLRYSDSALSVNVGVNAQHASLENKRILPNSNIYQNTFENVLPFVRFRYKLSKTKHFRIFYRTYTDAPSVNQVQDVIDNENPLQLSVGNAQLNQAYQNRIMMYYSSTNIENFSSFNVNLSAQMTKNYIGRSTFIAEEDVILDQGILLPKGAQIRRPVNLDGYYNISGFAFYSLPIEKLKINVNADLNAGYTRTPGLINEELNFANNSRAGIGLGVSSNISEDIDFHISTSGNYNWVVNSLNDRSNQNFYSQNSSLNFQWNIWKGIILNTEANHYFYTGLSDGYNQNYLLWNVGVGKKFLKDDKAEIRLIAFDILNQNNSIERTTSEIYYEDVKTNVLQSHFMLRFTYNLSSFSKAAGENRKK